MTKQTAGLLGSLDEATLRAMTTAQLQAKADAIEATRDDETGEVSMADEADLLLVNRELERRDGEAWAPEPAPLVWFLATAKPRRVFGAEDVAQAFLVQATAGAAVEDALKTYGIDSPEWVVSWDAVDNLAYGVVDLGRLTVIPAVRS